MLDKNLFLNGTPFHLPSTNHTWLYFDPLVQAEHDPYAGCIKTGYGTPIWNVDMVYDDGFTFYSFSSEPVTTGRIYFRECIRL